MLQELLGVWDLLLSHAGADAPGGGNVPQN